jgi:hypothetical protein
MVERRHEANRAFQQASAAELAKQYQDKYRTHGGYRSAGGIRGRGGEMQEAELLTNDVAKQSLIPGVNDPGALSPSLHPPPSPLSSLQGFGGSK